MDILRFYSSCLWPLYTWWSVWELPTKRTPTIKSAKALKVKY